MTCRFHPVSHTYPPIKHLLRVAAASAESEQKAGGGERERERGVTDKEESLGLSIH